MILLVILVTIVFKALIRGLLFIWWNRKKKVEDQDLEEVVIEKPETKHQEKTVKEKMRDNMNNIMKTEEREGVIIYEYTM